MVCRLSEVVLAQTLTARLRGSFRLADTLERLGIGVAKRRWLARDRGDGDVTVMRTLKRALDPAGVLNPGVLLP